MLHNPFGKGLKSSPAAILAQIRPAGSDEVGQIKVVRLLHPYNVSFDNPQGVTDFGPASGAGDPLPYPEYSMLNNIPYGLDSGGCVTYGDISFVGNYWSDLGFFNVCPFSEAGVSYPTNLTYTDNRLIHGIGQVPRSILDNAGVRNTPR